MDRQHFLCCPDAVYLHQAGSQRRLRPAAVVVSCCLRPLKKEKTQPGLMDPLFSLVVKPNDFATMVEQVEY